MLSVHLTRLSSLLLCSVSCRLQVTVGMHSGCLLLLRKVNGVKFQVACPGEQSSPEGILDACSVRTNRTLHKAVFLTSKLVTAGLWSSEPD